MVLFRRDLRTRDNPALTFAMDAGPTLALYVLDNSADGRPLGGAARWWLHHAIDRLRQELADLGIPLVLRRGDQNDAVAEIAGGENIESVFWNRRYTPWGVATDSALASRLAATGLTTSDFAGAYLREPAEVTTRRGTWYRVFTPYHKASLKLGEPEKPLRRPGSQPVPRIKARTDSLAEWDLLPTSPDWASGLRATWPACRGAPEARLAVFVREGLSGYEDGRNRPGIDGSSALSPCLAFGELSPRQIWYAVREWQERHPEDSGAADAYLRQLVWRDFCTSLLFHVSDLERRPFRRDFERFRWRSDPVGLRAWQRGRTGYPWIDAGMRQLWTTGWMPNRVRMGVASFLTKHLLLPWQLGEAWFWDTLVDADPAQNIANWQWIAGCGADAAPYFRIFNPVAQGKRFDPDGAYLGRWQPEASGYDPGSAGIPPIVGHREGRERALAAYRALRGR